MGQLTLELDKGEMGQLLAAANALHIDPSHMTPQQLVAVLTAGDAPPKKKSWRKSVRVRRSKSKAQNTAVSFKTLKNTLKLRTENHQHVAAVVSEQLAPVNDARARRLVAIMSVHGMWKDNPDKPEDAVEYQREVRAEWP